MHTTRMLLLLAFLSACSSPGDGSDPARQDLSTMPTDMAAPVDLAPGPGPRFDDGLHGQLTFGARVTPYGAVGVAGGEIYKAPRPRFQREVARQGDCRLLSYKPAFCDRCDGVCVADGVCEPFGVRISAGVIDVTGTQPTLRMTTNPYLMYEPAVPVTPNVVPDAAQVRVTASGGEFAAFSVTTSGVSALKTGSLVNFEIALKDSEDFTFRFTPEAVPGSRLRLSLNANNRGHGAPYQGIIECDVDDARGEVIIARSLIAAFPSTYRWEICAGSDCPLSTVTRYRRAIAETKTGAVAVDATSAIHFFVLHNPPK